MNYKCQYYDKGLCYAPITMQTNACKGKCLYPQSCPVITQKPMEERTLLRGGSQTVQWQSSNKGGKINHKNFDEQPTKERRLKWYDDVTNNDNMK